MFKYIVAIVAAFAFTAQSQTINGAGATFPAPVYAKWAADYKRETNISINYQAVGSGAGIKQIAAKTVDFGATDDPLNEKEVKENNYYQFPAVIGGVVPVVNVKGVDTGKLVLDGRTLADIFNSKIKNWNDAAIAKLNPGVALPDHAITLVVRADASGTTAVFTDYLSQVNAGFRQDIGSNKQVQWKTGNTTAGKGNAGVAAFVQKLPGAIGYVEYAFVKQSRMNYVRMLDKAGKPVEPDDTTFAQAAANANWSVPGMAVNLNNQAGWPITAATFIIVHKDVNREVLKFFDWAFAKGNESAVALDYVAIPDRVKTQIRADWAKLK